MIKPITLFLKSKMDNVLNKVITISPVTVLEIEYEEMKKKYDTYLKQVAGLSVDVKFADAQIKEEVEAEYLKAKESLVEYRNLLVGKQRELDDAKRLATKPPAPTQPVATQTKEVDNVAKEIAMGTSIINLKKELGDKYVNEN